MAITAQDVNKLRQMTGAGMMDCKKALTEADGDFDKAIEYLRKKGQKVSDSRADRETSEGIVYSKTNDDSTEGVIVAFTCARSRPTPTRVPARGLVFRYRCF